MNQNERMNQPTAAALLEAATELFAEHGYAGTSIRMITRAAGANLAAVTYHFGTKRELYGAVLERAFEPLAEAVGAALSEEVPPLERVDGFLRTLLEFLRTNPAMPRLMLQEVAGGRMPPEEGFRVLRGALESLAEVIAEGQADGTIVAGDPFLQAASVVAQPVYFTVVRRVVSGAAGVKYVGSFPLARAMEEPEAVVDQVTAFARRGLAKGEA